MAIGADLREPRMLERSPRGDVVLVCIGNDACQLVLAGEGDQGPCGFGRIAASSSRRRQSVADLDGAVLGLPFESDAPDHLPVCESGDQVVTEGALVAICGSGTQEHGGASDIAVEREVLCPGVIGTWLTHDDAFGLGDVDGMQDQTFSVQVGHLCRKADVAGHRHRIPVAVAALTLGCDSLPRMVEKSVFDGPALVAALAARRVELGLEWPAVADALAQQSSALRAELNDHGVCSGALVRTVKRGSMSCQYAVMLLQWLGRAPEEFLTGQRIEVGLVPLPTVGPEVRLRWDLPRLYSAVDAQRREGNLTWVALATQVGCTPSRLTNLRTARMADMELTMRLTQWLSLPAADFVHPANW